MDITFDQSHRTMELPPVPTIKTETVSVRTIQARTLWDRGCGREHRRFEDYLVMIPQIPSRPRMQRLWQPILIDPTIDVVRLAQSIGLLGVDACAAARDVAAPRVPYWIWVAFADPVHRGRPPLETLRRATRDEAPLSLHEVISVVAQDPLLLKMHGLVAGASHLRQFPSFYLAVFLHEGRGTIGVAESCALVSRMRTPLKHVG